MDRFDRDFNRMRMFINIFFIFIAVMTVGTIILMVYTSIKAGCLESMVLNGLCLSDPKLDTVAKDVLKNVWKP